jgi:UDPglucose 6-dehydrogenase
MKNFAVFGQGFVGGSLTTVFSERGFNVYSFDIMGKVAKGGTDLLSSSDYETVKTSPTTFIHRCESKADFSGVYFVCLPTPMFPSGAADLRIVESVLDVLATASSDTETTQRIAVVKSTVPPGSVERWNRKYNDKNLHIVFNPEFLTEANALEDMRNQNRIILGGPRPWINTVKMIFQTAFPKVQLIKTSSTTAEMVKYVTNCFLATKVSFANEMYQTCFELNKHGLNVDYDKVIEYAKHDHRLGETHWAVPGPDGNYGFGGHCFPKDLNALMFLAKKYGVLSTVLQAVWDKNLEVRQKQCRDWEKQVGRAVSTEVV